MGSAGLSTDVPIIQKERDGVEDIGQLDYDIHSSSVTMTARWTPGARDNPLTWPSTGDRSSGRISSGHASAALLPPPERHRRFDAEVAYTNYWTWNTRCGGRHRFCNSRSVSHFVIWYK